MIVKKVIYSPASAEIVNQYNNRPSKDHNFWSEEVVKALRKEMRDHYIHEQKHLCCYCGIPEPSIHGLDWDVEHIAPKAKHPEFMFTEANLAVVCKECNGHKGSKNVFAGARPADYPTTADAYLVVHPHFDEWSDHLLRDHLTYAAFTAKGRWTIEKCRLNRFDERVIGIRYPISDTRFEKTVRQLLDRQLTLQEVADIIEPLVRAASLIATRRPTD
ncbi:MULTISPECIES: HNH endonuclease [unclassified Microbacterium]|uniref:HNH endonuclease n=1 Tax=unclassified Microbacterium TaxID=2609290 RepID=UPI00109C6B6F|nr:MULTISPECIES: HNH endonuclease [unclassified Microbacterium]